jgi:hypothetical protein
MNFLNAHVNVIVSPWSFDMFIGNLFNIFTEDWVTSFLNEENFTNGKSSYSFCIMSMLCFVELDWKVFRVVTRDTVNTKIYELGTVCMSTFLNQPVQEFLGSIPSMILIIFYMIIVWLYSHYYFLFKKFVHGCWWAP